MIPATVPISTSSQAITPLLQQSTPLFRLCEEPSLILVLFFFALSWDSLNPKRSGTHSPFAQQPQPMSFPSLSLSAYSVLRNSTSASLSLSGKSVP